MTVSWSISRFVRGCIGEDVDDPEREAELDQVFDRERIAEALKRVEANVGGPDDA